MKRVIRLLMLTLVLAAAFFGLKSLPAAAYSNNNLIDDVIFDNDTAMSASQIDSWLNSNFPSSCISSNSGFTASDPIGYSPDYPHVDGKYLYGSPVTAGKVIYDAAIGHGINPQVLLTKLQNEEQLVDGSAGCSSTWRYASAVGYACTDSDTFSHNYTYTGADPYSDSSALPTPIYYRNGVAVNSITGSCVNTNVFAGFSEQVVHAAWFLSSSRHKAEGDTAWAAIGGGWNHCDDNNTCPASYNIPPSWGCYSGYMTQGTFKRCPADDQGVYYDGYAAIDGQSIHLDDGATAALYRYTPHFQSFDSIFTPWFGPTLTSAYAYSFVNSSSATLHFEPGQSKTSNSVTIRNSGSSTWYADGSVPSGQHAVRLAMRGYKNNPFADTSDAAWLGTQNQIQMTPSSVAPGQNATFTFNLKAPGDSMVGSPYIMYFLPVVDGVTMMPDVNMGFTLYDDIPAYSVISSPPSSIGLVPNQSVSETVQIKNDSASTWYADGNVPSGGHAFRLALNGYQNSPYADSSDSSWLGTQSQIQMTPSSVAPGQNATFTFRLHAPLRQVSQKLTLVPVLDGLTFLSNQIPAINISNPAPQYAYSYVTATNPPSTMHPGDVATVSLTLMNKGNVVWANESAPGSAHLRLAMVRPTYRSSAFYDSSAGSNWLVPSQVQYTGSGVGLNGNVTFSFNWKAPSTPGRYVEYFAPVLDGYYEYPDVGMGFAVTVSN